MKKKNPNEKSPWEFPVIKHLNPKSIADDIIGEEPKTAEQMAKGRPIKPYPYRFDDFNSPEDFKEFIRMKIRESYLSARPAQAAWLTACNSSHLPFDLTADVYYTQVMTVSVNCYEPTNGYWHCIRHGLHIAELKPSSWSLSKVEKLLEELKEEFKEKDKKLEDESKKNSEASQ